MKNRFIILISILTLLLSCNKNPAKQKESKPKVRVKTVKLEQGYLPNYLSLSGKTVYMNKNRIISPINGYLTKVNVSWGDVVKKGKLLFEIQTRESLAIEKKNGESTNYGKVKIYAPTSGRIINLSTTKQGVFVNQADVMCVLLTNTDLRVQIELPFEYRALVKMASKCKIILPDQSELLGRVSKILPQINQQSQTLKILAKIKSNKFLPENMMVKVLINKEKQKNMQLLSKKCLQTDALMSKFWVVKIVEDSLAVRIPVVVGNQTHDKVEIISPQFKASDLFVSKGAYGLIDSTLIQKK